MSDPAFLSIPAVAKALGLSPRGIWRLIDRKLLPIHRFGRAVRVSIDDLERYIRSCRES